MQEDTAQARAMQEGTIHDQVAALIKEGLTQTEIAQRLGISRQRVSVIEARLPSAHKRAGGRPACVRELVLLVLQDSAPLTAAQLLEAVNARRAAAGKRAPSPSSIYAALGELARAEQIERGGEVAVPFHPAVPAWRPTGTGSIEKSTAPPKTC